MNSLRARILAAGAFTLRLNATTVTVRPSLAELIGQLTDEERQVGVSPEFATVKAKGRA